MLRFTLKNPLPLLAVTASLHAVAGCDPHDLGACDIVWNAPSRDSFDSMPLPGARGAGANVWVQDGAVWIYLAHNGAYDEAGRLLKLGCLRLTPAGVDWKRPSGFRQSQDMAKGSIVIEGAAGDGTRSI